MKIFKKVSGSQFRLDDTFNIVSEANMVVSNLSGDKVEFSELIDNNLRNQIISRRVSQLFLVKHSKVFQEYPYITINVEVDNEDLIVTLGGVPDVKAGTVFLNGVLE